MFTFCGDYPKYIYEGENIRKQNIQINVRKTIVI